MPAKSLDSIKVIFSKNLKQLSDMKLSVAHICRELKINRQQYNRYLAGDTLPNTRSLRRIAEYFGVEEDRFFESAAARQASVQRAELPEGFPQLEKILGAARSSLPAGIYYVYTNSRAVPDCFVRGIIIIKQDANFSIFTRYGNDRSWPKRSKYVFRERFDGYVSDHNGSISMTGTARVKDGTLCHMILQPLYAGDLRLMTGLSLAVQSTGPLAVRFLMEFAGERVNPVTLAKKCGLFSNDTDAIDPAISNFLLAMKRRTPLLGLYSRLEAGEIADNPD